MDIFPAVNPVLSEFEKIKKLAEAECLGEPGRLLLRDSSCITDFDQVEYRLKQAREFKKIVDNGETFPTDGFTGITEELLLLAVRNSVLQAEALLNLLEFSTGVKAVFNFFERKEDLYPLFAGEAGKIPFENKVISAIEEILDGTGTVKTNASADLARIRRALSKKRAEAERLYQQIIAKYKKNGWIADADESMRNGRRVITIFAGQKRAIRGIVHDISATGKTVFIEPEETTGINNELYELEQEEKREIYKILKILTDTLRPYGNLLARHAAFMALCDFSRARALFAISTGSNMPLLSKEPLIDLKNARHPLLYLFNKALQKSTIPFSLRLDRNRILVISGPNAGGKTVCMKTIGLAQLMLQSGFLIPADETSTMSIFEKLMVDLGDSQSIEYELSTYSSRLALMKTFIEEGNNRSLFLIDEFGTGTDPNLGGALAEAVLEELHKKSPFGIITTHYLNLKLLAERTPGIINGSMAFDPRELRPLYRLIIGKPGSSYTFVVAERSGLPGKLIESASQKIDKKSFELEKLLTRMENDKNNLQNKLKDATANEKKLSELIRKYASIQSETEKIKNQFQEKLKDREAKLIEDMNRQFKSFMKEWKSTKNKKQLVERFSRQLEIKYSRLVPEKQKKDSAKKPAIDPALFKPGLRVKLNGGRTTGIIESIDGNKARVLFGDFYTLCKLNDLEIA